MAVKFPIECEKYTFWDVFISPTDVTACFILSSGKTEFSLLTGPFGYQVKVNDTPLLGAKHPLVFSTSGQGIGVFKPLTCISVPIYGHRRCQLIAFVLGHLDC